MSEELFEKTQSEAVAETEQPPEFGENPWNNGGQSSESDYRTMDAQSSVEGQPSKSPYEQPMGNMQNPQGARNPYGQSSYARAAGDGWGAQNAYEQNPYTQTAGYGQNAQNPYVQQPTKPPKGDGVGFGIASLVLGIVSVFLFGCCVNYITAILAIVFAVVQMVKNRQKGMAIAGIVTACVSILLGTLMWIGVSMNLDGMDLDNFYDEFYEFYEEEYPLNNYMDEL